ncbi:MULTISPECIES: hypothetical protein [unclassified Bradyrhizobium]
MTDLFFAEAVSYSALREAIRARVEQLNITRQCVDDVAGLSKGHAGKLLSPCEVKRFGMTTLGLTLQALGLKLLIVDDRQALAKVQPMFTERALRNVRLNNDSRKSKGRITSRPKSTRVKKPPRPKRGKPYLSH